MLQLVLMMSNIFVEIRIINQTQAATAYPSEPLEYTSVCSRVRVARSLVFYIVFCISLFVPFFLAIIFVFPSLIFHFWFSFWYLQTFLIF